MGSGEDRQRADVEIRLAWNLSGRATKFCRTTSPGNSTRNVELGWGSIAVGLGFIAKWDAKWDAIEWDTIRPTPNYSADDIDSSLAILVFNNNIFNN